MQYPDGLDASSFALLDEFQHDFPLLARPFGAVAQQLAIDEEDVLRRLRRLKRSGHISRIGAVWTRGAGGAGALCALAVPRERLEAVAAAVSREPAVSHNYERAHAWNLWYVLSGPDEQSVRRVADRIARNAHAPSLFLPMVKSYNVDLGFRLAAPPAAANALRQQREAPPPVEGRDRPLAALAESGLALVSEPYRPWADELGWSTGRVLATLHRWKAQGTLRRFGVVVRHHELGFTSNAMTVVHAPDTDADEIGNALARQRGVTLAYRRAPADGWPYNVYFMVHGREAADAQGMIDDALAATGAGGLPVATLYSTRRFKQTGGRYFCGVHA